METSEKPYSCPNVGCIMKFKYRMEKKRHLSKCDYPASSPVNIPSKESFTEMDSGNFQCNVCTAVVNSLKNLSRHMKICKLPTDATPKIYPCEVCGKAFLYKSKLGEHSLVHKRNPFHCYFCGKNFKIEPTYNNHLKLSCGSSFGYNNDTFVPSLVDPDQGKTTPSQHKPATNNQQKPTTSNLQPAVTELKQPTTTATTKRQPTTTTTNTTKDITINETNATTTYNTNANTTNKENENKNNDKDSDSDIGNDNDNHNQQQQPTTKRQSTTTTRNTTKDTTINESNATTTYNTNNTNPNTTNKKNKNKNNDKDNDSDIGNDNDKHNQQQQPTTKRQLTTTTRNTTKDITINESNATTTYNTNNTNANTTNKKNENKNNDNDSDIGNDNDNHNQQQQPTAYSQQPASKGNDDRLYDFTVVRDVESPADLTKVTYTPTKDDILSTPDEIQLIDGKNVVTYDLETPPRRKQYRLSKKRNRAIFQINEILENVEEQEKVKILESSKINPLQSFTDATLSYFKRMLYNARRSHKSKVETATLLMKIFGNKLFDADFQEWFVEYFSLENVNDLLDFLNYASADDTNLSGRPLIPIDIRQQAYNFWKANSQVSTHRSNGRHIVKILQTNRSVHTNDLEDDDIVPSKKIGKVEAHRKFTVLPYKTLYNIFSDTAGVNLSFTSFRNLKPFYVTEVTVKEMESCLCSTCLNSHNIYNALRRGVECDLSFSLTEFLCEGFNCTKNDKIGYYDIDCILNKCNHNCCVTNVCDNLKDELESKSEKTVTYYIFETAESTYFDSHGRKKTYSQMKRKDKCNTLKEMAEKVDEFAGMYLRHQFLLANDNYYWRYFLANSKYHSVWLDYSQNIALTHKLQVQSAHYSGKQQTLHNAIIQNPVNGKRTYVYHVSDDTNHDSVLTFTILEDIIEKHPEIIEQGVLVLRSDNCPIQYKCKYVFYKMICLAKKYNIKVAWFYGTAGHGKGLIDAMSSFGCKQPLRHAIIANDMWFEHSADMLEYLNEHFKNDENKEHYIIDSEVTARERQKKRKEYKLKGNRKCQLITVDADGIFTKVLYHKDEGEVINLEFNDSESIPIELTEIFEDTPEEYNTSEALHKDILFEVIEPGTFVGMLSPQNAIDMFFVAEVVEKCSAPSNICDDNGHEILAGERYVIVHYLEKKSEGRKKVKYGRSRSPKLTYIHLEEVFCTNIDVDEDLCMNIDEYQSLLKSALC